MELFEEGLLVGIVFCNFEEKVLVEHVIDFLFCCAVLLRVVFSLTQLTEDFESRTFRSAAVRAA